MDKRVEQQVERGAIMLAIANFSRLSRSTQIIIIILILAAFGWVRMHHGLPGGLGGPTTGPTVAPTGDSSVAQGCSDKAPYGAPTQSAAPSTALGALRQICRPGYLVGYSGVSKTPAWVAEHLESDAIYGKEPRTNNFQADTSLPADERAELGDYARSGYDRGHMAPAADFSRNASEMSDSFYLSNMVPQFPENNRAPWAHLEGHVRKLAGSTKDLYVITGPVFSADHKTIGQDQVFVPTQLFKIVLDTQNGRMGAWLLPNAEVPGDGWNAYCTSVRAVEQASGLAFFPNIPAAQREQLENMKCAM